MYRKAKKNFGVIRKILEIFFFQNPLSKFSKIFFFKNFRIAPKFFFDNLFWGFSATVLYIILSKSISEKGLEKNSLDVLSGNSTNVKILIIKIVNEGPTAASGN